MIFENVALFVSDALFELNFNAIAIVVVEHNRISLSNPL